MNINIKKVIGQMNINSEFDLNKFKLDVSKALSEALNKTATANNVEIECLINELNFDKKEKKK